MNCTSSESNIAIANPATTTVVENRAKILRMPSSRTLSAAQSKRVIGLIEDVIAAHDGNVSAASRSLNMRQQTLNAIRLGSGVGFLSVEALAKSLRIPIGVILNDNIPKVFIDVIRESPGRWTESVIAAVSHWAPVRSLDRDQIRAKLDATMRAVEPVLESAKHRPVR